MTTFLSFSLLLGIFAGCTTNFDESGARRDAGATKDGNSAEQCGNGVAEGDEVCDGNDLRGLTCQTLGLGDGVLQCSSDCTNVDTSECERLLSCGNGILDEGEGCDDGNHDNSDDCPDDPDHGGTCQPAFCGDGFVWAGHEECDDGNHDNSDDCPDNPDTGGTCQPAFCGDGFVWAGHEGCDDGNQTSGDGCSAQCEAEGCGNGILDEGEGCDDGNHDNSDDCPDDPDTGGTCQPASCGDGFVWAGHEECDDSGVETASCDIDCTSPVCGDGHVNIMAGEGCDDGNHDLHDSCPDGPGGTCQPATCGDSLVWTGHETCDSGGVDTASCDSNCTSVRCGDTHTNTAAGEQCDSGGADTASCDSNCTYPACGDDHVNTSAGEDCEPPDSETSQQDCQPGYFRRRTCQSDCTWGDWGPCMG